MIVCTLLWSKVIEANMSANETYEKVKCWPTKLLKKQRKSYFTLALFKIQISNAWFCNPWTKCSARNEAYLFCKINGFMVSKMVSECGYAA